MKTQAAVLVETGKPLALAELEIPPLKAGQALVEVVLSGVCHTQLLESRGFRGEDRYLPHCLGHEGVGLVRETGPGVRKVKPGEAAILSWMRGSGADGGGTSYRWGRRRVNAGPITTFSRYSVVSEDRLTALPRGIPMEAAALLGCAVATGVGIVLNTAGPRAGQSLAVFGAGGIGLCAVAGAALAGCSPVIAVDVREERLRAALQMGATHAVLRTAVSPAAEIRRLCPRGLDFAVEASGRTAVMREALDCVRERGGTAVIAGNARSGDRLDLDPRQLNLGKRLLGTWGGDNEPDRDFPRYGELLVSQKINLAPLLSRPYPLRDINKALDDLETGRAIRPVIDPSGT